MNIKECYEQMGENYASAFERLGSEDFIKKYLVKYRQKNEMEQLKCALEGDRYEEAYTCAHNMKGFGMNLALSKLADAGSRFCEAIKRDASKDELYMIYDEIKEVHITMDNAMSQMDV